jgi:hypothetical protein
MQTLNEHGPQPTADDKPQWPRDFDFSEARAEQQELLDADDHREVALNPFSGADSNEQPNPDPTCLRTGNP